MKQKQVLQEQNQMKQTGIARTEPNETETGMPE